MEVWGKWADGDARLTNVVLCALGFLLVRLAQQFGFEAGRFWIGFEDVALLSAVIYVGAVVVVRTQPVNRATLWIVVWFAVAMHVMTFLVDPFLSSDMYRYVWDGMVQHHGISPYRYVPGDPALSWLRAPNQEIFDNINRRGYARTIYPPVAQMVYWLAAWFAPTVDAMKLMMLAFEGIAAWALVKLLGHLQRPAAEVLLLLWCPLLVWEIGDAAHVDAVVIGFVALALLLRWRGLPWLTGLLLGCAVMTKFYPVVLFPALWGRRDWRMPAALVAVIAVGYGLYARVGWLVFGFLGGYQKEEGMDSGTRYFPLEFARTRLGMPWLPNAAYYVVCGLVMGGIVWWCWRRASVEQGEAALRNTSLTRTGADNAKSAQAFSKATDLGQAPAFVRGAGALAFAMMLLFSPHYPWYVIWLVPFMVLAPSLPMYTYVLGLWFGLTTALAEPGPKMFLMNERLYTSVVVAFLLEWMLRRWSLLQRPVSRQRLDAQG